MYTRKIYKKIEEWKKYNSRKKTALLIKGLRQIGKTTVIKEFCANNYKNIIYIDFKKNTTIKTIFDGDLDVDRIILNLSLRTNKKYIPNETVIIFDEIQECANARASLKYFVEDGRFDIIGSGSLLGLRGYNKKPSKGIPTGFETILTMKPMDFEEFLWAKGIDEKILNYLEDCFINKTRVDDSINSYMMDLFKQYLCVGGLPAVVEEFLETNNMHNVLRKQRSLLEEYKDDFGKHLDVNENEIIDKVELARIMEVYNSIPNQLAKENKKFQYSMIDKSAKGREYRFAVEWLKDFGLIELCHNIQCLELPLDGQKDEDCFKVYVQDTGLFVAMLEEGSAASIFNDDLNIYKGAVYENLVADAFIKNEKKLYYYRLDSGLEIDFVTRYNHEIAVIEVKAKNSKAKSLKYVLENKNKYDVNTNFKLINGNIGNNGLIYTYPLYMAFLIK